MLNIILCTLGSAGDLHPFVGLGRVLAQRGHRVRLAASPVHERAVAAAGLELLPLGTVEEFHRATDDPRIWSKVRGGAAVAEFCGQAVRPLLEHIQRCHEPGRTVVGASSLCLGARVAEDALGIPTATIHLQPSVIPSCVRPGVYAGLPNARWLPQWWWRGVFGLADWMWDRACAGAVNEARATFQLPPVQQILTKYMGSPRLIIGMWPDWFAAPAPDWPAQVKLAGFGLYDDGGEDVPANLDALLAERPVAISLGSSNKHGRRDYAAAIAAVGRLGRRALVLTRHPEQLPRPLPAWATHVAYAPFSQVLPRCSHHGGIGTMAQAMRAGCPQVMLAMTHDQPDNADRAERLGVAAALRSGAGPRRIAAALARLLDNTTVAGAAAGVAQRMKDEDGLAATAEMLEELARG
jgi:rhamnosyltransferase subunit B